MKNLKLISTILLSVMLIFTISTAVFADNESDEDIWSNVNVVEGNNTIEDDNTLEENNTIDTDTNNVTTYNETDDEEESEYNNLYTTTNSTSTTTNSENLADTGIGDSNGTIALIVIVSAVVAIYSARKFNDYKNI